MLFALGINHKTAPIAIRERMAVSESDQPDTLTRIAGLPSVEEAAILSTCNRSEWYFSGSGPTAMDAAERWLSQRFELPPELLREHGFRLCDEAAVRHSFRVACGLDSLVLGEPQILGQMKSAYQLAQQQGVLGWQLDRLFQHAFNTAKLVRSATAIGQNPISVAFAAVTLARQLYGDFSRRTALLIGAGETIELALRHLQARGIGRVIIANRTPERAARLALACGGVAIGLSDIPRHLADADIVISSTGSPLPILGKGTVERAIRRRRHRPIFMVDIAVPRDVEPEVGELEDVYLYTVDDLQEVIADNLETRKTAAREAEHIVEQQSCEFMRWLAERAHIGAIQHARSHGERVRDELLARARQRLQRGDDADAVLAWYGRQLTNRLLHRPTVALKQALAEGDMELANQLSRVLAETPDDSPALCRARPRGDIEGDAS